MVRWLVRIVVALVAFIALVFGVARLHDGPLGPIPGGPLESGELVQQPVADWSFAKDEAEAALQLETQSRSRTVWILALGGKLYVPCSLGYPPGKTWYKSAIEDGRATLRIGERRYPVLLTKLDDAAQQQLTPALQADIERKYGRLPPTDAGVWIFGVTSR